LEIEPDSSKDHYTIDESLCMAHQGFLANFFPTLPKQQVRYLKI